MKLRETIADYLTESGFVCLVASSGEEGLEIFGTINGIDIILLDGTLPNMDGLQVLKKYKKFQMFLL